MKKFIFAIILLAMISCSSAKYAANFHPVNTRPNYTTIQRSLSVTPLPDEPGDLLASASKKVVPASTYPRAVETVVKPVRKTYLQMSKGERKNLRKQLRTEFKKYTNSSKDNSPPAGEWGRWDQDLKMAAIFGAIGTTGLIIGTEPFFIIGAIALIIGVVFLVKWLVRQ